MKNKAKQLLKNGFLAALIFSSSLSFGQSTVDNYPVTVESINDNKVAECEFLKFETKLYENKVYINWVVINRSKESLFVVEHSTDGKEFKSIGLKEGAISPGELPLMFSYVHENLPVTENYYRIKFFGETNQVIISGQSKVKSSKNVAITNLTGLVTIIE